jgi:PST family polysaccharide transporter
MADPHPALADALRVLTVAFVVEGLGAVALAWFEANLRIERTLGAEMLRTGVYCAIVLAAAAQGAGFWSFVIAQSAGQILFAAALWWRARGGIELHLVPGATGRMVVESIPLGSIWLLGGAVTYADPFIVGRLFSREQLGLYAAAYFLAFFVFRILQLPFGRSLYPAFLAFRDRPEEQFRAFRLGTVAFLALEVPAALVLALNAELVVTLVFGPTYAGAAPYLRLLAFAPLADPLGRFGGELLIARHRDRARVLSLVLHLTALVVGGVALSIALGTPFGMAWANFLPLGAPVILAVLLAEVGRRPILGLIGQLAEVYFVPALPFAAAWWFSAGRPWLRLALSIVAAIATLGWTWLRHRRDLVDFFSRRPAVGVVEGPLAT